MTTQEINAKTNHITQADVVAWTNLTSLTDKAKCCPKCPERPDWKKAPASTVSVISCHIAPENSLNQGMTFRYGTTGARVGIGIDMGRQGN